MHFLHEDHLAVYSSAEFEGENGSITAICSEDIVDKLLGANRGFEAL
jgi:hypothetical protein